MKNNWLLWIVYLLLLAVLLPHTAWAFAKFEPVGAWGAATAWAAAFTFEAAIAVFTHLLAQHIWAVRGTKRLWRRRYWNAYAGTLVVAWFVSTLANLAHAVEFGQDIEMFVTWPMLAGIYPVAFGAILPSVSFLFARALSNVIDTEQEANEELMIANRAITKLRRDVRDAERRASEAEQRANETEQRFGDNGDIFGRLTTGPKKGRVLFAHRLWPDLPVGATAKITKTSKSHVSEILNGSGENGSG